LTFEVFLENGVSLGSAFVSVLDGQTPPTFDIIPK
jgi:hypothetical protein